MVCVNNKVVNRVNCSCSDNDDGLDDEKDDYNRDYNKVTTSQKYIFRVLQFGSNSL